MSEYLRGTNSQTSLLHTGSTSLFIPKTLNGVKPYVTQLYIVKPKQERGHEDSSIWDINHTVASYLGKMRLKFSLDAPGLSAAAPTTDRRCDFAGFIAVKKIILRYQSNDILERRGDEIYEIYHNTYKDEWKKEEEAKDVHGNLSVAQRIAEYGNRIDCVFEIPFPPAFATNTVFPSVTSSELTVEVEWAALSDIIESQTGGAVTVGGTNGISNQEIELESIFVGQSENQAIASNAANGNGIMMPISDLQRKSETGIAGTGVNQELEIDLKTFTIASQSILFSVADENTQNIWASRRHERVGRGLGGGDNLTIRDVKIIASAGEFKKPITLSHLTNDRWAISHPSKPGGYLFEVPLSFAPQASGTSAGMEADFSSYSDPKLVINFTGALGVSYRFRVWNVNRNILNWNKGNFRKFWK